MDLEYDESAFLKQAEQQNKRKYLQDEIVDKNYDKDLFHQFFVFKTDDGQLSNINFEELQNIVMEFKQRFRPGQTIAMVEEEKKIEQEKNRRLYEIPQSNKSANAAPIIQPPGPFNLKSTFSNPLASYDPSDAQEERNEQQKEQIVVIDESKRQKKSLLEEIKRNDQQKKKSEEPKHALASFQDIPLNSKDEPQSPKQVSSTLNAKEFKDVPISSIQQRIPDPSLPNVFQMHCLTPTPTILSGQKQLKVTVSDPVQIKGGVFSSDYVTYDVYTFPLGWKVKRRYSDFSWLRDSLVTRYPGRLIPPVPPKITTSKRLQWDNVLQRQQYLTTFCNAILSDELLRTSEHDHAFIANEEEDAFKRIKNSTKKMKRPDQIAQLYSIDGCIKCDVSDKTNSYNTALEYLEQSFGYANKLKKEAKNIVDKISSLSESLLRYAEICKQQASIQYMMVGRAVDTELCEITSQMFGQWSKYQQNKILKFDEYFNVHNSYYSKQCEVLKNMIKDIEVVHKQEIKEETKGRPINNFYAMINHMCDEEITRVSDNHTKQVILNSLDFAQRNKENSVSFQVIWEEFQEKMERLGTSYKIDFSNQSVSAGQQHFYLQSYFLYLIHDQLSKINLVQVLQIQLIRILSIYNHFDYILVLQRLICKV